MATTEHKFVILYETWRWGICWSRNNDHVAIIAHEEPSLEEAHAAVVRVCKKEMHWTPARCIKVTGFVKETRGEPSLTPLWQIWPFTLKCFKKTWEREEADRQAFVVQDFTEEWTRF